MSTKRKAEGHSRTMSKLQTKPGSSITDSERDSGFSDSSNIDTRDSDGLSRSASRTGSQHTASMSGSQPPKLAMVEGSYSKISPMIIMNNVLLKQPGDIPPSQKQWEFGTAVEVVQPGVQQPQVVFVQPVVSHRTNPKEASKRRRPKKYLPILRSYPKIAPHPGDSSGYSGRGSSCSSYSSSSESDRGVVLASSHRERHHREKQQRQQPVSSGSSGYSSHGLTHPSPSPCPQRRLALTPALSSSPIQPSPAISRSVFTPAPSPASSPTPLPPLASETPEKPPAHSLPPPSATDNDCGDNIKRKRFCNTYNILSKSGLLDITLRTKDLLRQNRRTQGDLDRLKEHTSLFLQALQNGDTSIWSRLQISLQEEENGSGWQGSLKADSD
ncbi:hypothetical protein UPYG_G00255710 [Umbra pygmaea]|uniref:CLOCK-interacting pacemaker n=1 Tax=Umbra pygmaea TaxID=75934 RepID=A0ABD0W8F1_UMBPY